jgi:hypothetical protein
MFLGFQFSNTSNSRRLWAALIVAFCIILVIGVAGLLVIWHGERQAIQLLSSRGPFECFNEAQYTDAEGAFFVDRSAGGPEWVCSLPTRRVAYVWIGFCELSDIDLSAFSSFEKLEYLALHRVSMSDTGLVHLQDLRELRHLDLSCTGITDDGLRSLEKLSGLRSIGLARTNVTPAGIRRLQEAIPGIMVYDTQSVPRPLGAW